jgi:uncharacterized membrane protein YhhN
MSLNIPGKKTGIIFMLLLLLHCSSIWAGWYMLSVITKLLLVPYLIFVIYFFAGNKKRPVAPLTILALFFSFTGDLALSFSGNTAFLAGMGAFMLTHICNSVYFWKLQRNSPVTIHSRILPGIIMLVIATGIFILLAPYLGQLAYPIIIYMFLISVMAVLATGTAEAKQIKQIGKHCFIPGAFLFVVSDSILAINRFLLHDTAMAVLVMLTYGMAQFFLVRGYMRVTATDL